MNSPVFKQLFSFTVQSVVTLIISTNGSLGWLLSSGLQFACLHCLSAQYLFSLWNKGPNCFPPFCHWWPFSSLHHNDSAAKCWSHTKPSSFPPSLTHKCLLLGRVGVGGGGLLANFTHSSFPLFLTFHLPNLSMLYYIKVVFGILLN